MANESPARQLRLLQLQRAAGNRAVVEHLGARNDKGGGAVVVQRFEAGHHERIERAAMTAPTQAGAAGAAPQQGFSDAEATATYKGNWSRDLSQVLSGNPVAKILGEEILFEVLNVTATKKFGSGLDPAAFGVYSPREHIDNPAGQTNADLLTADLHKTIHGTAVGTNENIGGGGTETDPAKRTANLMQQVKEQFAVNAAGLPAYLGSSIQYVEEEFSQAARLGRANEGAFFHLGNGLHTVEDLFAHSNYIEIALGHHLDELPMPDDLREQLQGRRDEEAKDPVDTISGKVLDGVSSRPILVTGTFVTDDTFISIAEAASVFLDELNPFATSNREWQQRTTKMLLQRYEKLAEGPGDQIHHAFELLGHQLAARLAETARDRIAGDQPKEDAGVFSKLVAGARGAVGSLVGSGIRAMGDLGVGIRELMATGATAYGKLPLSAVYDFTTGGANAVDEFFKKVDQFLQPLPRYDETKAMVEGAREELRKVLAAAIDWALKGIGEIIKSGFVEAQVQATNIAMQIKSQIEGEVKNEEARKALQKANPKDQISMLMNPAWCKSARIAQADAEKIASMIMAPNYIKASASHSQIAKDHSDSPFFGTAAALASFADTKLRDLMIAVWESEHNNVPSPGLAANYADERKALPREVGGALPPPEEAADEWDTQERVAERKAQKETQHYKDLRRRREGEQLRREGHLDAGDGHDHDHESADSAKDMMSPEQRELLQDLKPVDTQEWSDRYAASRAQRSGEGGGASTPERDALFDFVRTVFKHPYDTDWYKETLLSWCAANQKLLADYIASRNRGVMHEH